MSYLQWVTAAYIQLLVLFFLPFQLHKQADRDCAVLILFWFVVKRPTHKKCCDSGFFTTLWKFIKKNTLLFGGIQKEAAFLLTDKILIHVTTNQHFF